MSRHRFKSPSHPRPTQKVTENLLNFQTPRPVIGEILQCSKLISALDVLGFVEGGRGVNVECFSEFAVTLGAGAEVCAGEIFKTAGGLGGSCETGDFLFVETTVTTDCYAGLTGGGLVACGGRVTWISLKIERGRYHLS
jgi:hypothetical protein